MYTCSRGREAIRNDERLYFKFIVKYIEGVHPEIFAKAVELHKEAKENNPGVSDLTKTTQFMTTVTPELPVPRYYNNRNLKVKNTTHHVRSFPLKDKVKNTTRLIREGSRMVLQIPLYKHESQPPVTPHVPSPPTVTPHVPSPPPVTPHVPSPPTVTSHVPSPPPVTPHVPSPPTVTPHVPSPPPVTPHVPSSPPLPITSDMYQELLTEIQRDPQMLQILNDFPFGNDDDISDFTFGNDDDGISDLVWDDISSLETEMGLC